jgi:hypothetical protein
MSQLSSHVEDYLAMRRALGFKLAKEGRLLRDFAAFAEAAGAATSPPISRSRGRSCPRTQARCGQRSG